MSSYARFSAMVIVATLVMFGLMYLNTYALDHVYFSQTRAYMALLMGATTTFGTPASMRTDSPPTRTPPGARKPCRTCTRRA